MLYRLFSAVNSLTHDPASEISDKIFCHVSQNHMSFLIFRLRVYGLQKGHFSQLARIPGKNVFIWLIYCICYFISEKTFAAWTNAGIF